MSTENLPSELLMLIFLDCLPSTKFPRITLLDAPLLLTQVCRRWRSISLTFPQLWSAIELGWDSEERNLTALDVCIERSGCFPLSVSIREDGCSTRVVEKIRPESSRLKAVSLIARTDCICPNTFIQLLQIPDSMPMLEDFRLRKLPASAASSVILTMSGAPRLSTLHLGGLSIIRLYSTTYSTYHAIRELRMHEIETTLNSLAAFRQCPSLHILEIALSDRPAMIPGGNDMHSIPMLHTLLITGRFRYIRYFLGHICLPALLRLSITPPSNWHVRDMVNESNVWPELVRLLQRSGCNLEELRMGCDTENPNDVVNVLKCMDSLKILAVASSLIVTYLNVLHPRYGTRFLLCPNMRQFEFHGRMTQLESEQIAAVFITRWQYSRTWSESVEPLRIIFRFEGFISPSQYIKCDGIQQCIAEGIEVKDFHVGKHWWTSKV